MSYQLSELSNKLLKHKAIPQALNHVTPVQAAMILEDTLISENLRSTISTLPIANLTEVGIIDLETGDAYGELTTVELFTDMFIPEANKLTCLCLCVYYGLIERDVLDLDMLISDGIEA